MNRTFDFYEYAGIIVPGAVLLMAIVLLFPESRALFSKEAVTLGELGLFIIVAYAAGQLVQAVGNFIEWVWWKCWGGWPSSQVLCGEALSTDQKQRLLETLKPVLAGADPSKLSPPERLAVVREVYSEIKGAGRAARVDNFNGSYGLMRGLGAAFAVAFGLALITTKGVIVLSVLAVLFLLAIHRMHRYGWHYATELFVQFLAARARKSPPSEGKA
jgi:hypothetical protein